MTDFRTPAARRPADDAEREARHGILIDLLAPYADGELPAETVAQIDAHLIACGRCSRELTMHRVVRARLAAEPLAAASPAFRDRIVGVIGTLPEPVARVEVSSAPLASDAVTAASALHPWGGARRVAVAVVALLAVVVAVLAVADRWRRPKPSPAPSTAGAVTRLAAPAAAIPLLHDVLEDYRRAAVADLPGRARDLAAVRAAVPFPVEPLATPELHLLAAWATTIGGEPAAVLAYRWDERLVMQYFVPEHAFFRHSAVRLAVAARRHVAAVDGAQGVVAWAEPAAGSILVADVAPERLGRFRVVR